VTAQSGPSTPTTYNYDPARNLSGYAYSNTLQTGNVFDPLNRLKQACMATSSPACSASQPLASYAYTLGAAGNRTAVAEAGGRNVVYGYDNDYRLTSEAITGDPNHGTVTYNGYDNVGNRTSMTSTLSAVPGGSFSYDSNDRLNIDTWDANGNTTSSGGISNTYDFENRLLTHGAVTIVYDGDGNRVSESAGGVTTKYLVDTLNPTGLPQVLDETVNGSVTRTYGLNRVSENQLVGSTWTPSFYGYDGHGNVRFLTNTAGAVTDTYQYDAFGMPIAITGTTSNNYLYSGEQFELRQRWYRQAVGRFITRDPIEGVPCSPLSYNPYIYVMDDPVDTIDPTGEQAIIEYLLLYHWIQRYKPPIPSNCVINTSGKPLPPPTARWPSGNGLQLCCRKATLATILTAGFFDFCHCFLILNNGLTLSGHQHGIHLDPVAADSDDNNPSAAGMRCQKLPASPCDEERAKNAFNNVPRRVYGSGGTTSNSIAADILKDAGISATFPDCAWGRGAAPYPKPNPPTLRPILPPFPILPNRPVPRFLTDLTTSGG